MKVTVETLTNIMICVSFLAARIAFSQRIYSVSEDVGIFIVSLLVESGTLGVDYRVSIFTSEQGAIGELNAISQSELILHKCLP